MKVSNLAKVASVSVLSLSLTALPFSNPASAQQSTSQKDPVTSTLDNINFDWGWLGLIGLLGLAGLAGKKQTHTHTTTSGTDTDYPPRYQDPNVVPPRR